MTSKATTPDSVIRAYLLISGLYTLSASLIWGVNTLFLLDSGLSLFEVFIANAVFTGAMALFEVPTGVVADTRGRRVSFLLSLSVLLAGTLWYVGIPLVDGGVGMFCASSVLLGLGYTFYSGAVEAWLVDALGATGYSEPIDNVLARGSMISAVAMLTGSIAGGVLGSVSLALPYLVRCALVVMVFVFAFFTMKEIGFEKKPLSAHQVPEQMIRLATESVRFGWRMPRVRLLIVASTLQSVFAAWGFHAWQPYFLGLLESKAIWVAGAIAALISLATIVGNRVVELATRYCGKRTTLMLYGGGLYSACAIGVGLVDSFYAAVALYLLGMASAGVYRPVAGAYMHLLIPREQRATVLSFSSLVGSGGSMMGQGGLGYLTRAHPLSTGYVVGGLVTTLAVPTVMMLRRLAGGADKIVGTAGLHGACAAQGLPDAAAVDTSAGVEARQAA